MDDEPSWRHAAIVLVGIREMQTAGTIPRYGAAVDHLAPTLTKNEVSNAVDTLTDFGLITGHYGPVGDGRAGFVLDITESGAAMLDADTEEPRQ
ncbi:MAG: hypothetical protein PHR28_04935 [candidate division Zixibacteria bacterium]|jgi:hypothetical protein|nr:hypothetical protein [candidate division Zixibacteria bacterium]